MQITVAGLGIKEIKQLTLETLTAVRASNAVLVLPVTDETRVAELEALTGKPVINVKSLYRDDAIDTENYGNIVSATLRAAEEHGDVTLLVPGHPRLGVTLVNWLEKLQAEKGFQLSVLPGISSFCTIINDLRFDPLDRGTVVADANRLLLFENEVDPCFNLLIYHVCSVGTSRVSRGDPLRDNQLGLLKSFLARHYGEGHEVTLISSSTGTEAEQLQVTTTIGNLDACYPHVHYGTTLFVPSRNPRRINREFLNSIRENAHAPA
jgi:uncharacterized protein YabN with tetrapyrrole methylase and pyrophosphatase domain